jgi:hypothetical protein
MPRPAKPHAVAATTLVEELGPPFSRGKGGPAQHLPRAETRDSVSAPGP